MIKSSHITTLTFYTFVSFSLLSYAVAETLPDAATYIEAKEEALEDLHLDNAALDKSTPLYSQPNFEWGWTDEKRKKVKDKLDIWANEMNDWFGETDPQKPATTSLRLVLDTRWADDPIEGNEVTVKPRIRGRLRLPVLEERLSLIIGDGNLDEDTFLKSGSNVDEDISDPDKLIDTRRTRDENASIALRWSRFDDQIEDKLGVKTDVDLGVRSVDDIYVKVSLDKDWYEGKKLKISNDNFYRYGLDSKHYIKGALNLKYGTSADRFINNRTTIRYRNRNHEESTDWVNDLRQVHYLGNEKQLAYGIATSGYFDHDKSTLNSYGPAVSYRQPIWREWFYVQTELNYLNDKTDDKNHYPSALLRMEALF
ncbi:hypothetical protein [uncultured Psychrobacter sp.]|uniref:hypothetical protein n=1 Tax=uncultured Psychrobacter sp. TaxID=259303 RepID=UPI003457E405